MCAATQVMEDCNSAIPDTGWENYFRPSIIISERPAANQHTTSSARQTRTTNELPGAVDFSRVEIRASVPPYLTTG